MADFVRFQCSRCGKALKAPPAHAGRKCACACGAVMRVPDDEEIVAALPDDDPEPQRPGPRRRNWVKTTCLTIVLPLLVTVGGGLTVEYLKPRDGARAASGASVPAANASAPAPAPDNSAPPAAPPARHANAELILGKWKINESPTFVGEVSVEFTNGQMIRCRKTLMESTTNYAYHIDEQGQLVTEPSLNVSLVSVTSSELVLSWGGSNARYVRPWSRWQIGLLIGAFVVLALLGKALDSRLR